MYGPVPALAALAQLGIKTVHYQLVDKDYTDWLKKVDAHPAAAHPTDAAASGPNALPHAIDWDAVWKEWQAHVLEVAKTHADAGAAPDAYMDFDAEPVRRSRPGNGYGEACARSKPS